MDKPKKPALSSAPMIARLMCLIFIACLTGKSEEVTELKSIRSTEDLARYISSMTTNNLALGVIFHGLDNTNTIAVTPGAKTIPIQEIYGTIANTRFSEALGAGFYEPGKKHEIREICAYQDEKGEVWRFHIEIFDEQQYGLMRKVLLQKMRHTL